MAVACGTSVATIYYNQPLLLLITRTFHVPAAAGGAVAVATQLGYATGILLFVPLGDVLERRGLMLRLFTAVSVSLVLAGLSPSFWILVVASVAIGTTAAVTHIIVPLAPELAPPGQAGRAVGTVMTGLLLGVLLGRTASGAIAELLGWRAVFLLAAVSTAAFIPLLGWRVPVMRASHGLDYAAALRSLWELVRTQPVLRESAAMGFLQGNCTFVKLVAYLVIPADRQCVFVQPFPVNGRKDMEARAYYRGRTDVARLLEYEG